MRAIPPLLLVCWLGVPSNQAAELFAAPDGSSSGDGSRDHPMDLATAISSSTRARAEDTIWLRGGKRKLYLIVTDGRKTVERSFYFTSAP